MLEGDWTTAARAAATLVDRFDRAKHRTLVRIGAYMERQLKKGMTNQAPGGKPYANLHPFTIAQRKKTSGKRTGVGTKALLHQGDLRNSITHELVGREAVFVGVLRGENETEDGRDFANLAEIHEFGVMIRVTPRMRAFLHHEGLHLAPDTQFIIIPPRPTFGPTCEAETGKVISIIADTMQKEMGRL